MGGRLWAKRSEFAAPAGSAVRWPGVAALVEAAQGPNRFDRLSKRIAVKRLTRRRAVRGLSAAGLASALFGLRRESAAADCPYLTHCRGRRLDFWCTQGFDPYFEIPGGPKRTCLDWG